MDLELTAMGGLEPTSEKETPCKNKKKKNQNPREGWHCAGKDSALQGRTRI